MRLKLLMLGIDGLSGLYLLKYLDHFPTFKRLSKVGRLGAHRSILSDADVPHSGPCFPKGHMVTTIEGTKDIGEIKEGDMVLTHTGRFQQVTKVFKRYYKGKLIHISPFYMDDIYCTPEHPLRVAKKYKYYDSEKRKRKVQPISIRTRDQEWIKAEELNKEYRLVVPSVRYYEVNPETFYKEIDTYKGRAKILPKEELHKEIFWEFVGKWLADGDLLFDGNYNVRISFNELNEELISQYQKYLSTFGKCDIHFHTGAARLRLRHKGLYYFLRQFKEENTSKGIKKIPPKLEYLPPYLIKALIRGYWKGDGHKRKNNYYITSICLPILQTVQRMLLRIGVVSGITSFSNKGRNTHKAYRLSANAEFGNVILQTNEEVKQKLWTRKGDTFEITIRDIKEEYYEGEVYNLEVAVDNSYTVNNIAVHNCWSSIYTGVLPEEHGITSGGWTRGEKYFTNIQTITIFDIIGDVYTEWLFNMPITWPPRAINGYIISGFPTSGKDYTYPKWLEKELPEWYKPEFIPPQDSPYSEIVKAKEFETKKLHLFFDLYKKYPTDVVFIGTSIVDVLCHRNDYSVYYYIDNWVNEILNFFDYEHLVMTSDHGFKGNQHSIDAFYYTSNGDESKDLVDIPKIILRMLGLDNKKSHFFLGRSHVSCSSEIVEKIKQAGCTG